MNSDLDVETTRNAIRITAEQLARSIDLLRSESGSLAKDRLEILEQRRLLVQDRLDVLHLPVVLQPAVFPGGDVAVIRSHHNLPRSRNDDGRVRIVDVGPDEARPVRIVANSVFACSIARCIFSRVSSSAAPIRRSSLMRSAYRYGHRRGRRGCSPGS